VDHSSFLADERRRPRIGTASVRGLVRGLTFFTLAAACPCAGAAEPDGAAAFRREIEPILVEHCYDCHSGRAPKAKVAFDSFASDRELLENRELWWKALKQLRAGFMPPRDQPQPSAEQVKRIEEWIKAGVFQIDPQNPDPGRVTVRRLNRTEYRNTIRDLLGVKYDTDGEFPPDDTGHGFDNIGEVLTISPLLLEKYITAAKAVVAQAVPAVSRVAPERTIDGKTFRPADAEAPQEPAQGELSLSYYEPASVSARVSVEHPGKYRLIVNISSHEKFVDGVFDYNKCELSFNADGHTLFQKEFSRQEGKPFRFEFDQDWESGDRELAFELKPLTPGEKQTRSLTLRINAVTIRGPMSKEHWVRPTGYERFFPHEPPEGAAERREYARELLARFAARAFRRPADSATADRLAALAGSVYSQEGETFESGVSRAMTAVLASPRFLFLEEGTGPAPPTLHPYIDEYALASRLSYFLWSSMPDDELLRLAADRKLRENLPAQVKRLLADAKSKEFVRNFTGQWLQARDIETVIINTFAVVSQDEPPDPEAERRRARFRELRSKPVESLTEEEKAELEEVRAKFFGAFRRFRQFELDGELRRAMRRETEMLFEHVLLGDRSLLELVDCDYTFLNERLARHYGIKEVEGNEMRLVRLPPDSPRGGLLTQGTVLAITSNPDRTSPVKRGLFILDNILGTPPPPQPPDVPPLEEAVKQVTGRTPTLREAMALHRSRPLCNSCHNRMDPLGLALENFNALGIFRESRPGREIDASGQLLSGESFTSPRELKHILVTDRKRDFYRCLTEKMLTYAVGRGLDYYDVHTVDAIVEHIEREDGRAAALLAGIIESAPFQKTRAPGAAADANRPAPDKEAK
jgi:hypothetical protein